MAFVAVVPAIGGGLATVVGGLGSLASMVPVVGGSLGSLLGTAGAGTGLAGALGTLSSGAGLGAAAKALGTGITGMVPAFGGMGSGISGLSSGLGGIYGGADQLLAGALPNLGIGETVAPSAGYLGGLLPNATTPPIGGVMPGGTTSGAGLTQPIGGGAMDKMKSVASIANGLKGILPQEPRPSVVAQAVGQGQSRLPTERQNYGGTPVRLGGTNTSAFSSKDVGTEFDNIINSFRTKQEANAAARKSLNSAYQ